MRLIKVLLSCLCVLLPSFFAHAKDNKDLIKANYYYTHYAFFEAIPYFEKIADELHDPVIYARLGDCYNITNELQKASLAYGKAVQVKGCSKDVILRHAQLLMQLMQYEEAEKWLAEYKKNVKVDRRIDNLITGCTAARSAVKEAIPSGIITFLPVNTDGSEFAPTTWKGQLVFASDTAIELKKKKDHSTGHSYYNLYAIHCDSNGNCAGDLNTLTGSKGVNTKYHNGPCTFSADGRQMYYTRSVYNDKFLSKGYVKSEDSFVVLEIMIASDFDSAEKRFRNIEPFQYNNTEYAVAHPSVSPDGKVMAISSNMPKGQGRSDIYICKKMSAGKWSRPVNAGQVINTEGEEAFPYWADNGTLCFSSDGQAGMGGLDIYTSEWDEKSSTFSKPVNIGTPLNSSYDDISLSVNAANGNTWFSSNRPAPKGGDNIYFYKRTKVFLQIIVKDSATQVPLPASRIAISAPEEKENALTDNTGTYIRRLYPARQYSAIMKKKDIPLQHYQ